MKRHERIPADSGLQPERTELAWRRTLLALTVASVASTRALYPLLGRAAVLIGIAGIVLAAALAITTRHRFARMHTWFDYRLRGSETQPPVALSGRAMLAMAALISIGGAFTLAQALLLPG